MKVLTLLFIVVVAGASCDSSTTPPKNDEAQAFADETWRSFHWGHLKEVKVRLSSQGRIQAGIKNKATEVDFDVPIDGWRVIESVILPGKPMEVLNRPRVDDVNKYCTITLVTKESRVMSLVLADAGDVLPAFVANGVVYQHDHEHRFLNSLPIRNVRPAIGQYMLIPELTRYLARYEGGLTEQERIENQLMLGHYLEWTGSE